MDVEGGGGSISYFLITFLTTYFPSLYMYRVVFERIEVYSINSVQIDTLL